MSDNLPSALKSATPSQAPTSIREASLLGAVEGAAFAILYPFVDSLFGGSLELSWKLLLIVAPTVAVGCAGVTALLLKTQRSLPRPSRMGSLLVGVIIFWLLIALWCVVELVTDRQAIASRAWTGIAGAVLAAAISFAFLLRHQRHAA